MSRFTEKLMQMLRNETDGFMATVAEPHEIGLPMYVIFNCYGTDDSFVKPNKHRKMIVEVAKEIETDRRCRRFSWKDVIPVEVSETPKIALKGRKLRKALSLFSEQEWEQLFEFIKRNRPAIQNHWNGRTDSLELLSEVSIRIHLRRAEK